jgi:hypothetical protein
MVLATESATAHSNANKDHPRRRQGIGVFSDICAGALLHLVTLT